MQICSILWAASQSALALHCTALHCTAPHRCHHLEEQRGRSVASRLWQTAAKQADAFRLPTPPASPTLVHSDDGARWIPYEGVATGRGRIEHDLPENQPSCGGERVVIGE